MSPDDWRAIRPVFDEAMRLHGAERRAFVERSFPGNERLAAELRALVAAGDSAGGLLDSRDLLGLLLEPEDAPRGAGSLAGSSLGAYRLVREIGSGGMGSVYLAERSDGEFSQQVAVKVLRPEQQGPEVESRFRRERQILARLAHPGIARLLDGGTSPDGRPYLVMELVSGQPVTSYCDTRRLGVPERLELFLQVTDAVGFAHQKLVVHRDLKPSNILVTEERRVKLLDFGIAKLLESAPFDDGLTRAGETVLTLSYASPEQVRGEAISTASDVYSLGVVLFQLLTGQSPYEPDQRSRFALERAVLSDEPPPPSSLCELPRDLDAVVLKALRKDPADRYPSVEALGEDLRRFLDGFPVQARHGDLAYRATKFVRRHAVGMAAAGILLVVLLLAGLLHTRRLERERNVARREAEKAFVLTDFAFSMVEAASRGPQVETSRLSGSPSFLSVAEQQARARLRVDPDTGAAMLRDVARLHMVRDDLEAAARLLEEALATQRQAPHLGPFETAETLRMLGKLASLRGQPEAAAERYTAALKLFERTPRGEGSRAAHTVIDLGNAFLTMNRLDSAAEAYRRAIDLMGSNDADPQWGRARNNLGIVALRRRDWTLAARLMGEALPNVERSLDETDHQLGEFLVTYANVLRHLGVDDEARRLASRGSSILERTLPPADPRRVEGLELVKALGPGR